MRILNIKRGRPTPGAVYIGRGRGSPWANPYRIGVHGDRDQVIARYWRHLWRQIQSSEITVTQLRALANRDLMCWCSPNRCHGEVIRAAVEWALSLPDAA